MSAFTNESLRPPRIEGDFKGKDFIEVEQLVAEDVFQLFELASEIEDAVKNNTLGDFRKSGTAAILFFQPSTRTFLSFKSAATLLGLRVIDQHGMKAYSSTIKGETLADTIRSVYEVGLLTEKDLMILRHEDAESSHIAAASVDAAIVNGGSGAKRHPTQGLLDLYTIWKEFKTLDNLTVTFMGDLRFGRTVKSLGKLLALTGKDLKFNLVAPQELVLEPEIIGGWEDKGIKVSQVDKIEDALKESDVLYITRIQQEWFEQSGLTEKYEEISADYNVNPTTLEYAQDHTIVMHPLPRVTELSTKLDSDPRARYFHEMRNGTVVRMALLSKILG